MLNSIDFRQCVKDNLKDKRYEHKRIDALLTAFDARVAFHKTTGVDDLEANLLGMKDLFDNLTVEAQERAKRTSKQLAITLDNNERLLQASKVTTSIFLFDGKRGSKGVSVARAAISRIESDPRFKGLSYATMLETTRGQLYAVFGDVLAKLGKGVFGRQKGAAHLPNIIREAKGIDTGDQSAKDFARAWMKIQDLAVDMFNEAGGSMRRLANYIPNPSFSPAKAHKAGRQRYIDMHLEEGTLDWGSMRWPDGTTIDVADRADMLGKVYDTKVTDGANKIADTAFRGNGRAVGNQLELHRFLHYKDPDKWLAVHETFGDGTVFDVFTLHINDMSRNIALVKAFGPNPQMGFQNLMLSVRKTAAALSPQDQADAEAVMKNVAQPMFELVMRENPMDPNSGLGNAVVTTSNLMTSALLGSASFLAIPGDFMQTAMVRGINHMNPFGGTEAYVRALTGDIDAQSIATQSGFVMDQVVASTYAATRFTGLATHGPEITRRIADATIRASLLSGHTGAARWATQAEFMGLLARSRSKPFAELPFSHVLERYGIDAEAWDAFRTRVPVNKPANGVEFLRPVDILSTDIANKQALYDAFQGAIFEESRHMVPEATMEATISLKDTSRPDTLPGAILHSFAMFKNFPVSFMMIYGRLGMTSPHALGRLGFYAGLGVGMTMVGALGTQMREMAKGRDPIPMDNAAFWGKSFLSGGALSIWGDFLFSGVNAFGQGPQDVVGGPITALLGDTTQLAFGDVFQWADTVGSLDGEFKSTTAAKFVEYLRRYTPGTSVWWARLALERQVWDRLQEVADPQAYRKRKAQMARQKKNVGNEYWWKPGDRAPSRPPSMMGQ